MISTYENENEWELIYDFLVHMCEIALKFTSHSRISVNEQRQTFDKVTGTIHFS